MERDDRTQAIRAIRRGLNLGITHTATAEMYGSGAVEGIAKASRPEHVMDNAGAGRLTLDAADLAALDTAFPRPSRRAEVPML